MAATVLLNLGRGIVANRLAGSGSAPTFMGWGTGAGDLHDAAAADTGLFTASNEARVNGTCTAITTMVSHDTVQLVAAFTSAGSQSIAEIAVYDAAGTGTPPAGGTGFLHATFAPIPVQTADVLTFTLKLVVA